MFKKRPFDITKCARPNILSLQPYTTTRFDYPSNAGITYLDANENAFGPSIAVKEVLSSCGPSVTIQSSLDPQALQLHRYPDPQQPELKQLFCNFRNKGQDDAATQPLTPENICLGVGSDESIDGILRAFCTPGKDKILICPPTYSAYEVCAAVNDVDVVCVNLDAENDFALNTAAINQALSDDPSIKVVFVCSPGNPAANLVPRSDIVQILEHQTWNGVVVADEAYIDFAPATSMAREVNQWPNLVVLHTLSKAFGLAGIRLGITFSQPEISRLLNNAKGPYNMSAPTVALATAALQPEGIALMEENRAKLVEQRDRLRQELSKIPAFGKFLGGFNANFVLAQFLNKPADAGGIPDNTTALALQYNLVTKSQVLVRYRGKEAGCVGCLRITVGTEDQVDKLVSIIRKTLEDLYSGQISMA